MKLVIFALNTEEMIESDEYGEAVFNAKVIHPEVDNLVILQTVNMFTKRVQLKVGLINKSLMGVHTHYRNICHLQQYLCTVDSWSEQSACTSLNKMLQLKFAQIQKY